MEVASGIFSLLSIVLFTASFVGLFRPDWFKQTKRWKAFTKLLVASFLVGIVASALLPESDDPQVELDVSVATDSTESAGSGLTTASPEVPPETAEDSPNPEKGEEGLRQGVMQVRVLEDDHLYGLKLEAVAAGKDVASMYPPQGPIAIAVVPVNRLTIDEMVRLLPLICEVTVEKEPNRWTTYSEVRILNRSRLLGWAFPDLTGSCVRYREIEYKLRAMQKSKALVGDWEMEFPWKLAGLDGQESIAYGQPSSPNVRTFIFDRNHNMGAQPIEKKEDQPSANMG